MASVQLRPACVLPGCGGEGARYTETQARGGKPKLPVGGSPKPKSTALRCTRCGTTWQSSWWAAYLEKAGLELSSETCGVEACVEEGCDAPPPSSVEPPPLPPALLLLADPTPTQPSPSGRADERVPRAVPRPRGRSPAGEGSSRGGLETRCAEAAEARPSGGGGGDGGEAALPKSKRPKLPASKELRISRNLQQLQDHNMAGPEDAPNTFMPSRAAARRVPSVAASTITSTSASASASARTTATANASASFGCGRCRWATRGCDRCRLEGDSDGRVQPART